MPAPASVVELIKRFGEQIEAYKSGRYNETQVRVEFIDPFFEALGWDIHNKQGLAPAYQDVVHEDAIKIGIETKAPDYCFRVGGTRKFFLEAKKPAINIKDDVGPAFQVRRYAWSSKLPLSILTDFEEFAVYDCRIKPHNGDKPSVGRVFYCRFEDYIQKWDEIAGIFSKEAVLKGSFDKFAETNKKKKGTTEVDDAFLEEIEFWRETLAKNIALRNPKLSQRELNFSVQQTIDRIIFLRICEDRGIEQYGRLQSLLNGTNTYKRLTELFRDADDRYNSGLFHFKEEKERDAAPDTLTLSLKIDDDALKDILKNLYYPDSPYEFSVLPADILGQVYEQFLGKVIRLTEGHHAKIEEKPEVRKAGGVYYTPKYIVDYIVMNTVGKLVEGKNPKDVAKLRILDPACGSGSFLIQVYQYLLDWHRDWYSKNESEKYAKGKNPAIYRGTGNEWRLTTSERKRILLNNIYGVDIDSQAVEVTKLSLLLKVLEGESDQSLNQTFSMFHERALPDLQNNIKCGNSLIGADFYDGEQIELLDDEERYLVNIFDWKSEFSEIFQQDGFNAVIGNPPYVRIQALPKFQVKYLSKKYSSAVGNCDLYVSFVELGFFLLKKSGMFGMIVPNKFFKTDYGHGLRTLIKDKKALSSILDFGSDQVFSATIYTCLLFLRNEDNEDFEYSLVSANQESLAKSAFTRFDNKLLQSDPWVFADDAQQNIIEKLNLNVIKLLALPADMSRGSSSGDDEIFMIDQTEYKLEPEILRTPIFATDFARYSFNPESKWKIIFPYVAESGDFHLMNEKDLGGRYPKTYSYLQSHQEQLKKRKQYAAWYGYSAARNLTLHEDAQIIVPLLANKGSFALIPNKTRGTLCPMASGGFTISISKKSQLKPEYVLGLLNSSLIFWKLRTISNVFRGGWITCTKQYFGELPIRQIDFSSKKEKLIYGQIIELVLNIQALNKKLAELKTGHEKSNIERQTKALDESIDQLVYELYGLSGEEIRITKEATV